MTFQSLKGSSASLRWLIVALLWLVAISILHALLNAGPQPLNNVLMGYMPVITNLAAPIVDFASKGKEVHFEAIKFASFAEMAEAFRSGHIQVAFIIAPLAIALYQQGVPMKVVYIGNRNESSLIVGRNAPYQSLLDMKGKLIAVPIRYSGHLLALKRYFREHGLGDDAVRTVEICPPDMPAALASGGIDGYFVGEPFASKSVQNGTGRKLLDVEAIWPKFICNLVIVRDELISSHPGWVEMLVGGCVRSGFWAREHTDKVQQIVSRYWNQDPEVVSYAFSHPPGRFRFDLYKPVLGEFKEIAEEMRKSGLLEGGVDLSTMIDDHFARDVDDKELSLRHLIEPKDSTPASSRGAGAAY